MLKRGWIALVIGGAVLAFVVPAGAQTATEALVNAGSPPTPFPQNKQNEPTVAVDPTNPNIVGKLYFGPGFPTILRTGGGDTTQQFNQRRVELRDNFNFAPMELGIGMHNFQVGGNLDFMHYNVNKSLTGNPAFATVRIGMRRRPVAGACPLG